MSTPAPAPAPVGRRNALDYLYTHNPFYAISASLMLFSVLKAYGRLEVGAINTWIMVGVLAAYTAILAVIGVVIVRRGKVWDDARSIFLVLLLLFLAVSVCADDLFARMKSTEGGTALLLCGYVFSAAVTESVLYGARIRLGLLFRVPYHLMLALFYVVPWWCSPQFNTLTRAQVEWTLFLFPNIAALLFLALIPAVRRGAGYVAKNGTPWPWPWFPWCAFAILAGAFSLRSYALCLAFGPKGPIWKHLESRSGIVFDTIWSPYFLTPLVMAILVLLLEMALVAGNRRLQQGVLTRAPLILLLCLPLLNEPIAHGFLGKVTETIGAPAWLTIWMLLGFYAWAWFRRVPFADWGVAGAMLLLCIVGPRTIDFKTLSVMHPWPLLVLGGMMLGLGMWKRSSPTFVVGVAVATIGLWLALTETSLVKYRFGISCHVLWLAILVAGLAFKDRFANSMRAVGALMMPVASLVVMLGIRAAADVPFGWRLAYVALLAALSLAIARFWSIRWFLHSFTATLAVACYGVALLGFRGLGQMVGRAAITAFSWSVAALLLGFLISAHKARWLPRRLIPHWRNGNGSAARTPTDSAPANGSSAD